MAAHNLPTKLESTGAEFPSSGKAFYIPGVGYLMAWGTADPTDQGYAKGCIFQNTSTGAIRKNTGTSTTAVWADV